MAAHACIQLRNRRHPASLLPSPGSAVQDLCRLIPVASPLLTDDTLDVYNERHPEVPKATILGHTQRAHET